MQTAREYYEILIRQKQVVRRRRVRGTNAKAIEIIASQNELALSTIATYVDGRQDIFSSSYL